MIINESIAENLLDLCRIAERKGRTIKIDSSKSLVFAYENEENYTANNIENIDRISEYLLKLENVKCDICGNIDNKYFIKNNIRFCSMCFLETL